MADQNKKTIESYLEEVQASTGKTIDDFRQLAAQKGITRTKELVAWLSAEYGLGYHHAGAISYRLFHADDYEASPDERIAAHFTGAKAKWRGPYDFLAESILRLGSDVELSPNMTYINVLRNGRKFAILQASASRIDIGLKLKGVAPAGRLEAAGSWNAMVTHRVRISDPQEIDAEVQSWLKQAYGAVKT